MHPNYHPEPTSEAPRIHQGEYGTSISIPTSPALPRRGTSQHNGEISQGAGKTSKNRPWVMQMIIYGFPSKLAALQFEWAWQNPHISRHLRDPLGKPLFTKERGSLKKNILYVSLNTHTQSTAYTFIHTLQSGQDYGDRTPLQHVATPRQVFHQYVKESVGRGDSFAATPSRDDLHGRIRRCRREIWFIRIREKRTYGRHRW